MMSRDNKQLHSEFLEYMDFITSHENYKGLAITKSKNNEWNWVTIGKHDLIRQSRIQWALEKAKHIGIENKPGVYADVMREIHPTKTKPCQICGEYMSIYYYYPTNHFLNDLKNHFGFHFNKTNHISDIWDNLITSGVTNVHLSNYIFKKFSLSLDTPLDKDIIISMCEYACRKGNKKLLSPGAMSNFPDRYDGFHSYNLCCRQSQDKGRHADNMKGYTKDRRAYEYWSDGNIHAANQFMSSSYFYGSSADHIGPISLGFVHDPRYLRPLNRGDNSAKRDRLWVSDVAEIYKVETSTGVNPISWYSSRIWKYIRENYQANTELVPTRYRDALKQNQVNFMYVMWLILLECGDIGEEYLVRCFLEEKYDYFNYSYKFDKDGNILAQSPRHFTDRNENETDRFRRIAIDSIHDFHKKHNRNLSHSISNEERQMVYSVCKKIKRNDDVVVIKSEIVQLMDIIQVRTISDLTIKQW